VAGGFVSGDDLAVAVAYVFVVSAVDHLRFRYLNCGRILLPVP
jgi:hypothetical protein